MIGEKHRIELYRQSCRAFITSHMLFDQRCLLAKGWTSQPYGAEGIELDSSPHYVTHYPMAPPDCPSGSQLPIRPTLWLPSDCLSGPPSDCPPGQGRRPRGDWGDGLPQNLRWGTAHALVPQYFEK